MHTIAFWTTLLEKRKIVLNVLLQIMCLSVSELACSCFPSLAFYVLAQLKDQIVWSTTS